MILSFKTNIHFFKKRIILIALHIGQSIGQLKLIYQSLNQCSDIHVSCEYACFIIVKSF